jgi:sugar/nucleoside kinase (ribokinase family)
LDAAAIPLHWLRAPVIHLAPLAREVDGDLAASLSGAFVGLTPQGWMRQWDGAGRVTNNPAAWTQAPEVLAHASAAVLSLDDIGRDWAVAERWAKHARVLVITQGPEGCTVFVRGQGARQFGAPPQREVDPTGAGDIFAAAFFINYYETDDPWASARLANQVAALSVTRSGLASVPTREEVGYCRTRAALGS